MTVWNPFTPLRESKMAITTRRLQWNPFVPDWPVSSLSTALQAVFNQRWPRFYRSQPSSWCLRERPPKDGKDSWRGSQEAYHQTTSEQQERMSSILSDFHSLKENQQPESGILVQHSQVQQSSASLQPESGVLVQHNQFQHLQSSANSTEFIARGGQIFPRPQYNFSNCNVQIHNHYGQSGWTIDSWHCDTFCPLKVIRFFEETDISIVFERTILSARCQFIQ